MLARYALTLGFTGRLDLRPHPCCPAEALALRPFLVGHPYRAGAHQFAILGYRLASLAAPRPSALRVHLMSGDAIRSVADIEQAIALHLPDAIYIDAAYLLSPASEVRRYGAARWEELTEVVRQLKQIAIRYNRPIFLTFQLNRQVKKRQRRELELSDIGGTDAIPQDASVVLGLLHGNPPLEQMRRIVQMMKNREGELFNMLINYGFSPVSFHELPMDEGGEELGANNVGWME